ncbi:MAG: carboxylating nicotinate-nucleotide diphosphorylase [Patescibacteria group bacterium]
MNIKTKNLKKYYIQKNSLDIKNKNYLTELKQFYQNFLNNDLQKTGDITTNMLLGNKKCIVNAAIYGKENGVIAGVEEIRWILKQNKIKFIQHVKDGEYIKNKQVILELKGDLKTILKIERILLNLLQRLSGIATCTNYYNEIIKSRCLITATRKTYWGLLDKKAVVVGGGGTHRLGLYDFILIKDNHIQAIKNNLERKIKLIKQNKLFWEIEVSTFEQAIDFAKFMPDAIMFDNFKPRIIKKALKLLKPQYPKMLFEASGNIDAENIKKYSKTGVDIISIGKLTHSVDNLDISLDIL